MEAKAKERHSVRYKTGWLNIYSTAFGRVPKRNGKNQPYCSIFFHQRPVCSFYERNFFFFEPNRLWRVFSAWKEPGLRGPGHQQFSRREIGACLRKKKKKTHVICNLVRSRGVQWREKGEVPCSWRHCDVSNSIQKNPLDTVYSLILTLNSPCLREWVCSLRVVGVAGTRKLQKNREIMFLEWLFVSDEDTSFERICSAELFTFTA